MVNPRNSAQIRLNNLQTLLKCIQQRGPISKRDLQAMTGLSWGAVSSMTGLLYEAGYVVSAGKQVTSLGRKPTELDINPDDHYVVGIDLNLSGLCGVVTDMKGRIVQKWLRPVCGEDGSVLLQQLMALLDEIVRDAFADKHLLGIGLAVQGFVDVENGVSVYFPQVRHWENVPLKRMVEERYGLPTRLMHDPQCLMVAEKAFGNSFMGIAQNAVLVRLDNGIGMALMMDGRLCLGANGRSGELGHVPAQPNGALCSCGNRGCLEEYASGNGLVHRFTEAVRQGRETTVDTRHLECLEYPMLGEAAQHGDALCQELFCRMGEYLGWALSHLFNVLNPDLVVLYGDLLAYRALFAPSMEQQLREHVCTGIPQKLAYSELGRHAAAQGVALLVCEQAVDSLVMDISLETQEK